MQAPNEPDVYADDMEPRRNLLANIYRVAMPGEYKYDYWANVYVEPDTEYCELNAWKWGEFRQPRPAVYNATNQHLFEIRQEVWKWLVEWEYVELRQIGPEDSDYFATSKLTGE